MTNKEIVQRIFDTLHRQKFAEWYNVGHFLVYITGDMRHTTGKTQAECDEIIKKDIQQLFGLPDDIPTVSETVSDDDKENFPIGTTVNVRHRLGDQFQHSFEGHVVGYHEKYITVEDQDGDAWDCDVDQIYIAHNI